MPPFQRKTLVLVGANHVGRRSMKERLIRDDPRRFGAVMPRMCLDILYHSSKRPIFFTSVENLVFRNHILVKLIDDTNQDVNIE